MSTENPNTEDYVLVPRRKARIGGARRGIIGLMIIGSIAAVAGAGTFASFSATTTNDATFKTVRLGLSNAVNGGSACTSPSAATSIGNVNPAIDTNNGSGCSALFVNAIAAGGTASSASVVITNKGDTAGDVYLFAPAACSVAAADTGFDTGSGTHGTDGNLCGRITLSVFDGTNCIYPAKPGACIVLGQTATSTFTHFATTASFDAKLTAAASLAKDAAKTYTVSVRMLRTESAACDAVLAPLTSPDDVDTTPVDGFGDATGIGCDNKYMNEKASLDLRWLIQA